MQILFNLLTAERFTRSGSIYWSKLVIFFPFQRITILSNEYRLDTVIIGHCGNVVSVLIKSELRITNEQKESSRVVTDFCITHQNIPNFEEQATKIIVQILKLPTAISIL